MKSAKTISRLVTSLLTMLGYVAVMFASAGHELSHHDTVDPDRSCASAVDAASNHGDTAEISSTFVCAICAHGIVSHTLPGIAVVEMTLLCAPAESVCTTTAPASRVERRHSSRAPPRLA